MRKTILVVLLATIFASPAFAIFCSKCGFKANDDCVFCSKCGNRLNGAAVSDQVASVKDDIALIDSKFAPVNDFEIFVFSSNYLTCIAKFPEFQILFNKNIKDIEEIENNADSREKQIISYYRNKWEILKTLQNVWSSNNGTKIRKQAYMTQFAGVLKYINEIIANLKVGISAVELSSLEAKLNLLSKVYKVKTHYLMVDKMRIPKNEEIGIAEISEDKVKVIHLGDWIEVEQIAGPMKASVDVLENYVSGWISKEEFLKRTDCNTLK